MPTYQNVTARDFINPAGPISFKDAAELFRFGKKLCPSGQDQIGVDVIAEFPGLAGEFHDSLP
jgi:hypothetical protein